MKTHEIIRLLDELAKDQVIVSNRNLCLRVCKASASLKVQLKRQLARKAIFRHAADEMRELLS